MLWLNGATGGTVLTEQITEQAGALPSVIRHRRKGAFAPANPCPPTRHRAGRETGKRLVYYVLNAS